MVRTMGASSVPRGSGVRKASILNSREFRDVVDENEAESREKSSRQRRRWYQASSEEPVAFFSEDAFFDDDEWRKGQRPFPSVYAHG